MSSLIKMATSPKQKLIKIFMVGLLSSWAVAPIGVTYLHYVGLGADTYLVNILLMTGACVPIQLLLNEYLATGIACNSLKPNRMQVVVLLILQFAMCCTVATQIKIIRFGQTFGNVDFAIAGLLSLNSLMSFDSAKKYYQLSINGNLKHRNSVIIGAMPGVVTLAIYVATGTLQNSSLLLFSAFLPALFQMVYIRMLPFANRSADCLHPATPSTRRLLQLSLTLTLLAIATTVLRERITEVQLNYSAIILVGLNAIGSVIILFTRADFFTTEKNNEYIKLTFVCVAFLICGLIVGLFEKILSLLFYYFSMQILIAILIAKCRFVDQPQFRSDTMCP